MLLILKGRITCFWLLWLLECACPEKVNADLTHSCQTPYSCLLSAPTPLSLPKSTSQEHMNITKQTIRIISTPLQ